MARLNEAPLPGETIDGLKRRFIRQNREIARANSTQALRIRSLEAETSRLLSENITLREENIQLKQELDDGRSKRALDNVYNLKEQLEVKIKELNDVVGALGKVPKLTLRTTPKRRKEDRRSAERSPGQRNWKTSASLAELAGDGRLPPILEDKRYPRRTLEAGEVQLIEPEIGNFTDSPDLDPPVAHLIDGDAAVEQAVWEPASPSPDVLNQKEAKHVDSDSLGFANLETRRKRRESNAPVNMAQPGLDNEGAGANITQNELEQQSKPKPSEALKVGAKRKLSSREEGVEPSTTVSTAKQRDENQPSGSRSVQQLKDAVAERRQGPGVLKSSRFRNVDSVPAQVPNRKVLGEKSVNTDPIVSPSKPRITAGDKVDKHKEETTHSRKGKPKLAPSSTRDVDSSRGTTDRRRPEPLAAPVEFLPKTPAPSEPDLFSPTETQPSTAKADPARDTPPPADLNSAVGDVRPGRRSRAAVSYAEPNLRDKMRRPTKELVDAVGADARTARGSSLKAESVDRELSQRAKSTAPKIKSEVDDSGFAAQFWKELPLGGPKGGHDTDQPPSPLQGKGSNGTQNMAGESETAPASDLPSTVLTDRRRRSSSTPSATLAALMAGSAQRISRARGAAEAARANGVDIGKLDLVNLAVEDQGGRQDVNAGEAQQKDERAARRHSSMVDLRTKGPDEGGGKTVLGKRGAQGRRATMTASARGNGRRDNRVSSDDRGDAEAEEGLRDRESSADTDGMGDPSQKDQIAVTTRTERAATRRRSMML